MEAQVFVCVCVYLYRGLNTFRAHACVWGANTFINICFLSYHLCPSLAAVAGGLEGMSNGDKYIKYFLANDADTSAKIMFIC